MFVSYSRILKLRSSSLTWWLVSLLLLFQNKVPLLSLEAIHHLHIFIFVLAITHVTFSLVTMLLGMIKVNKRALCILAAAGRLLQNFYFVLFITQIREWKHWEDAIQKEIRGDGMKCQLFCLFAYISLLIIHMFILNRWLLSGFASAASRKVTHVHQFEFIKDRFQGFGKDSVILSWLVRFASYFILHKLKYVFSASKYGFVKYFRLDINAFDLRRKLYYLSNIPAGVMYIDWK